VNRRALIIANPGAPGRDGYLNGVEKDVDAYKTFFTSPIGGLWNDDEIVVLFQPSVAITRLETARQKHADYSVTIFTGHGYHVEDDDSTIVELSPNVDFDSVELRVGAPRHTLILDCCRVVHPTMFAEDSAESITKSTENVIDPADCRRYFDEKITDCLAGLVVLFSCSIDETAADISNLGGLYSSSLLRVSQQWSRDTRVDTSKSYISLTVADAHERAERRVISRSGGRQSPVIEKPRSEPYFPFCIIA
jgi:Caspase domain